MESITEGVNNTNISDSINNRINVSNTQKPLFFFVNLAKRYMQQYNEVELSALGSAIASVVSVAEILKQSGLAVEKKIKTSTVVLKDNSRVRPLQKARIEIILEKTANFDELMAAAAGAEAGKKAAGAEAGEKAAAADNGENGDNEKGEKAAAADNGENGDNEKGEKAAAADNDENGDNEKGEKPAAENNEKGDNEEHTA